MTSTVYQNDDIVWLSNKLTNKSSGTHVLELWENFFEYAQNIRVPDIYDMFILLNAFTDRIFCIFLSIQIQTIMVRAK